MIIAPEFSELDIFNDKGIISKEGTPAEIFGSPKQQRTREFLSRVLGG